jgi:O-antigen ligase
LTLIISISLLICCSIGLIEKQTGQSVVSLTKLSYFAANQHIVSQILSGFYRENVQRAAAVFAHPIIFSQFIAAAAPFLFVYARYYGFTGKVMGIFSMIFLPFALMATGSRSGILLCPIALIVYFVVEITKKARPVSVFLYILLSILAAYGGYKLFENDINAIISGRTLVENVSNQLRDSMIVNGFSQVSNSPITGFGDGMSAFKAGYISGSGQITIDNSYLSALLDFGYVGLALYITQFLLIIFSGYVASRIAISRVESSAAAAATAFCVAISTGQYVISVIFRSSRDAVRLRSELLPDVKKCTADVTDQTGFAHADYRNWSYSDGGGRYG